MNPELLELIRWFKDAEPDAWPDRVRIVENMLLLRLVGGVEHGSHTTDISLSLIEVAVMDWLEERGLWVEVYPGEYDEEDDEYTCTEVIIGRTGNNGQSDGKGEAATRFHAMMRAVKEMHDRGVMTR